MVVAINYLAVLVAAIASMVVGGLWYSPLLFGKQWMKMMKFNEKDLPKMKEQAKKSYVLQFVSSLVLAYVLAHFMDYLGVTDALGALQAAFWIWLGFKATGEIGSVLWEGKSWSLFLLNTAHSFVTLAVMSLILALWV